MRAVVYHEYGTPEVLRLTQVPIPRPGVGEVLVEVLASSVNDWDYHLLTGRPVVNRAGGVRRPQYPILGADVAGRVASVGAGVTRLRPGDEVMGDASACGFGGFAEFTTVTESALTRKPSGLSFEQAAAVPQAGGLALAGLRYRRPIRAGESVLVNGAGGGVGTLCTQVAAALGAHVTGVDAGHKLDAVRAAGARQVVDYRAEDAFAGSARYDRIVDVVSHRPMRGYRRVLRHHGVAAIIGGSIPRVFLALALGPLTPLLPGATVGVPLWKPNDPVDTPFLTRLLDAGAITPVVDRVYPLEQVADAFARFGESRHVGKIVITTAADRSGS